MLHGIEPDARAAAASTLSELGGDQGTRMKNRIAGLLMATGTLYNKQRLHGRAYFSELLGSLQETPASLRGLLRISRSQVELFETIQRQLVQELRGNSDLAERVERLMSIDGVGEMWRSRGR